MAVKCGDRREEKQSAESDYAKEWAAWILAHWPTGMSRNEFARQIGKGRSLLFEMIAGRHVPPIEAWARIAEVCGLEPTPWSLVPTARFRAKLRKQSKVKE